MRVRMVVSFHLVLQILHFLLQFLDLIFERLDPLVVIGVVVSVLCLGHVSSLNAGHDRNTRAPFGSKVLRPEYD